MTPVSAGNLQLCIGTVYAGTMTVGSHSLATDHAAFTAADVGRKISVIGAGANTGDPYTGSLLVSTIATYVDSQHVTLADAALTACGGGNSNTTVYRPIGASVGSAMSFDWSLTSRDTGSFTYISPDGSTVMIAGSPVWVYDLDRHVDVFGGAIDQVKVNDTPGSAVLTSECQCVGWDCLLSKRLATPYRGAYTAMTLAAIATDVINYQCGSEGITVVSVTGPALTVDAPDFNYCYEYLDSLCEKANDATHTYVWSIDAWRVVRIVEQTAVAAPWNIDDRDGSNANALDREGEGITITWSREKLANRDYEKASRTMSPDIVNDAQKGDGSARSYTTKANIESLVSLDVDGTPKTFGLDGIDSGRQWYWTPGSNSFRQDDSETVVPDNHWVHLSYYTSSATVAFAQNDAGVDARAAIEGGTGYWDATNSIDTLISPEGAAALAATRANIFGYVPAAVDILTHRAGLKPAQVLPIHLSNLHIDASFLIDSVSLDCTDNIQTWTIHAVNGALIGDWRTALIALAGGSTGLGGGMLPTGDQQAASAPTVFLDSDATLGATAQTAMVNAAAANRVVTLPLMVNWIGLDITIVKNDTSAHTVTWQCQSGQTVNSASSGVLTDPGQSITLRAIDSTHAIIVSSGVSLTSPPPATYPIAPNVTGASANVTFAMKWNATVFTISGTVNLPATDANYPHLKALHVYAIGPDSSTAEVELTVIRAPFTGATASYAQDTPTWQDPADHTYRIEFRSENEDGTITPGAYGSHSGDATYSVAVHGARVTSVGSPAEVGSRYVIDADKNRLPWLTAACTPVLAGNQVPQDVTYLISDDSGATWTHIGVSLIQSVGQQIKCPRLAPGTAQTWKFACAAGFLGSAPTGATGKIPDSDLPTYYPGIQRSAGFSVAAIATPAVNNGITATVGAFEYRQDGPEKTTYGYVPPFTGTDPSSGANTDFYFRIVITDLDASHNPISARKPHDGWQISGPGVSHTTAQPLLLTLSGNAGGVRYEVFIANKASTGTGDFAISATNTLQSVLWNGTTTADHYDVMFGALPTGAMRADRLALSSLGTGLTIKDNLLVNMTGALVNGDFEYGLTGWNYDGFVASAESYSGAGCVKQTLNTVGGRRCFQVFNVIPGQNYLVTAYLKNETAGTISLDCPVFTAGYTSLVADSNSGAPAVGGWQRLTTTVTIPATGAILWVGVISGPGSGNVWADKITMELSDPIPAPTGTLGLTASFVQGTPTPSGEPQFGWSGTITLPADRTNYNGCHIGFVWAGEAEQSAGDLDATTTTFQNGYWPQPKAATHVTLRAYPVSVDNQRGVPTEYYLGIPAASTGYTNLGNADPVTLGPGVALRNGQIANTIAGNLLNGGFEDGLTGWSLEGNPSPAIDTTVFLSGTKSLKLTVASQDVSQRVDARPGQTWKLTWSTRNELVGTTARVLYAFRDKAAVWLGYEWRTEAPPHAPGAGVWDTFSIATAVAPADTADLLIYSPVVQGVPTSGACWVDSIAAAVVEDAGNGLTRNPDGSIKLGTSNTANLLANWNFADGLAHWGTGPDVVATGGVAGSQYLNFAPGARHFIAQTVDVRPNQCYYFEISAWASSNFSADIMGIYVQWFAADGTSLYGDAVWGWNVAYAGWTACGVTITAPATAATGRISIDMNVTVGNCKIDNVVFQNAPSTGPGTEPDGKGGVQVKVGDGVEIVAGKIQAALADGLTMASGKVAPNLGGGLRVNPASKLLEVSNADVTAFAGTVRPVSIFSGANPTLPDVNYPAGSFGFRISAPVGLVRVNAAGTAWVAGITSADADNSIVSASYLTANYVTAGTIAAAYASFSYLSANYITASAVSAAYATFSYVSSNYATISSLNAKVITADKIIGGTCGATVSFTAPSIQITTGNDVITMNQADHIKVTNSAGNYFSQQTSTAFRVQRIADSQYYAQVGLGSFSFSGPNGSQWGSISYNFLQITGLPSFNPGAGSKQFWYDPADSNRVKFAA